MGQLAKMIRDKYPGQYDDMDDDTLEKAVLAKYPEYKDLVDTTPAPQQGTLSKIWKTARTPLVNAETGKGGIGEWINPVAGLKLLERAIDQPIENPIVARMRGFTSGALEGIGNIISGATAPLDLALMATTGGASATAKAGYRGATSALNATSKAIAAPLVASGAQRMYEAEGPLDFGLGALETIGAGSTFVPGILPSVKPKPLPAPPPPPPPKPQLLLPERGVTTPGYIAGPEGVAPNRPWEIDPSATSPDFMSGSGTVLDSELGGTVNVDPSLPAGGVVNARPTPPISDAQAAFDALIPNRYKPEPTAYPNVYNNQGQALPGQPQLPSAPPRPRYRPTPDEPQVVDTIETSDGPIQRGSIEAQLVDNTPTPPLVSPITGMPAMGVVSSARAGGTNSPYPYVLRGEQTRKRVIGTLIDALSEARPIRAEQERIYSVERGKRFDRAERVKTKGEKGFYTRLRQMRGELPKLQFESIRPKFNQAQINSIFDMIQQAPMLTQGQKLRASTGFAKLLGEYGGHVPQNNEIQLLSAVFGQFGDDTAQAFVKAVRSNMSRAQRMEGIVSEVASFRKALMASFDLSAPLRQGLPLMMDFHSWKNPFRKEWFAAWDDMFKSFGSENAYKLHQDMMRSHKDYSLADRVNLEISDVNTNRPEVFGQSQRAEKLPGVGRVIRASNRAYTSFLNDLRMNTFSKLLDDAERLVDPNVRKNEMFMRELANYINTSTGVGSLGRFAGAAERLNYAFFSPKLMASRFQMLDPTLSYYKANPFKIQAADFTPEMNFVRKEKIKALLTVGAVGSTMAGLAGMAGANISLDPKSSDFMKIRMGNARIDLMGGFQQYAVLYSRLAMGARTSSVTGRELQYGSRYGYPNLEQAIMDFFYNKASPEFGMIWLAARQKGPQGEPIDWNQEQINRTLPILLQDIWELAQEDPAMLPFHIPAIFGAGVQVYGRERPRPF